MSERILVTGGAGFLGSHVVERLVADGHTVHVVDDLSSGSLDYLATVRGSDRLHIVVDSILNYHMMNDVVGQVDRVVHLSAAVGVRRFLETPVDTITATVRGTEILLNLAHKHERPLFLASTSEVYGLGSGRVREDHERVMGSVGDRRSAGVAAKGLGEVLGIAYHADRGLPVTIGRFFDLVGPRQTETVGASLVNWIACALRGDDLAVPGDGTAPASFCHVLDAVDAVVGLIASSDAVGEAFNIGSEAEHTTSELAARVCEVVGSDSSVVPGTADEGTGPGAGGHPLPDTAKIRDTIGWAPARDLGTTIRDIAGFLGEPEGG